MWEGLKSSSPQHKSFPKFLMLRNNNSHVEEDSLRGWLAAAPAATPQLKKFHGFRDTWGHFDHKSEMFGIFIGLI